MSIVSVQPKDFILALFIRDDGERFLLGDNGYDFMDSQLHFSANTIENDEVEKQGADGTMLAGQVRRASVQTFDGYVGDATTPKEEIEQMRRAFIAFFLKGHHYRVVYVDCARNAWQRKGGYLVDAPEVKELFQVHPEYHVGLNFEDVNYYSYDENAEGDEITANLVQVAISSAVEGGLVWDKDGAVSDDATTSYITEIADASGKNITINDATSAPLKSLEIQGETSQQTYTGKNLFPCVLASQYPTSSELKVETDANSGTITFTALGTSGSQLGYFNTGELNASSSYTISMQAKKISGTAGDDKGRFYVRYRTSSDGSTWTGYTDLIQYTPVSIGTYYQISGTVSGSKYYQFLFYNYASTPAPVGEKTEYKNIQLVSGSTPDYDYEPYVGGVPAPNPDYPQAVQTVTGEQTISINSTSYEVNLGKNLFDKDNVPECYFYINGKNLIAFQDRAVSTYIGIEPNTTYTITKPILTNNRYAVGTCANVPAVGADVLTESVQDNNAGTLTITSGPQDKYLVIYFKQGYDTTPNATIFAQIQVEKGSQATSYAAYFTPIELCGLGDDGAGGYLYKDSIYKNLTDNKWYLHKEVGKITLDGSLDESIVSGGTATSGKVRFNVTVSGVANIGGSEVASYSDNFVGITRNDTWNCVQGVALGQNLVQIYCEATSGYNLDQFRTWLGSHNTTVYYPLATPTDTEITNATLIAQLEAILNGGTHAGTNNIALIPSGNEQGSLEITYYTKYIVNITAGGYEWEQGGSGGPTIVMNESIDNVYPIWTITGPITNPVLENTTTGEQIEYVGTIGEGQKLIIDMGAQTALLDGLNVLSNVAGEFISLAPGANTLLYSVSNGDTASEIGWSEIVG